MNKILIIGIGNTFRCDDGLGIYIADKLSKILKKVDIKKVHQLDIVLVSEIKDYNQVIFIDCHQDENLNNVYIKKINPENYNPSFTSHISSPSKLLSLTENLYKKTPTCYLVAVKGYKFSISDKISSDAKKNVKKAIYEIKKLINFC